MADKASETWSTIRFFSGTTCSGIQQALTGPPQPPAASGNRTRDLPPPNLQNFIPDPAGLDPAISRTRGAHLTALPAIHMPKLSKTKPLLETGRAPRPRPVPEPGPHVLHTLVPLPHHPRQRGPQRDHLLLHLHHVRLQASLALLQVRALHQHHPQPGAGGKHAGPRARRDQPQAERQPRPEAHRHARPHDHNHCHRHD